MKVAPPDVPMPGIAGRREGERLRFGKPGEALVEAAHDDVGG